MACFKPMGAPIFFANILRPIKIVPLARLKFGYMKFYRVIYAVENKMYGIFTVCRYLNIKINK